MIVASTGDDGWYDWDVINNGNAPPNAANMPNGLNTVVAVGGTSLYLNPNGTRNLERVWNDNGPNDTYANAAGASLGAAGSGCSQIYAAKTWQKSAAGYASLGCKGKRSSADIAALADPFTGYDIRDTQNVGGWATIGGTSLAAPVISALWALAGGSGGVKYPSATLYKNFKSTPSSVYDVTLGGTGACDTSSTVSCANFFQGNPNSRGRCTGRLRVPGVRVGHDGQPRSVLRPARPRRAVRCRHAEGLEGLPPVAGRRSSRTFPARSSGRWLRGGLVSGPVTVVQLCSRDRRIQGAAGCRRQRTGSAPPPQPALSRVVERALRQRAADALPFVVVLDLGVGEHPHARRRRGRR